MRRITLFFTALLVISVANPAHANTKRFGLTGFTRLIVLGDMIIEITPDHSLSALAEGSRSALDTLDHDINNDTLTISQAAEGPFGRREGNVGPIHIRMTAQNLSEITVRGSGSVTVRGLRGGDIAIALDGPGAIDATIVSADSLRVRASGSGAITLAGRVTTLQAFATGSASVAAAGLATRDMTLRQTGTGSSSFAASHMAAITASGQANVSVAGRPQCTVNNLGAGTVTCGDGQRRALPTNGEPGLSRDPR